MRCTLLAAAVVAASGGCSSSTATWPELHPVKGTVKVGGQPATAGYLIFRGEDAAAADYIVGGAVGNDGSFTLSTTHALDKSSSARSGAPAGSYRAMYMPPDAGNQVTGPPAEPIPYIKPLTVTAGANDFAISLPAPKK
jgi:hypothetical protein